MYITYITTYVLGCFRSQKRYQFYACISRAGVGLLPVLLGAGHDPLLHEVPRADHPRGEGLPPQDQMCQDRQEAAATSRKKHRPVSSTYFCSTFASSYTTCYLKSGRFCVTYLLLKNYIHANQIGYRDIAHLNSK